MRKIFLAMSEATTEKDYRYLALSYLFGPGKDAKAFVRKAISQPAGV